MEIGIFAKTFSGDFDTVCAKVAGYGLSTLQFNFSCIGLPALPGEVSEQLARETFQILANKGLRVAAISATFNMISPDKKEVESGLQCFKAIANSTDHIPAQLLTLCTGSRNIHNKWEWHPDNANPDSWSALTNCMEKILEIAEIHDVFVGVEPEMGNVINSARKAKQLIDEMQSDRIKVIFDPANLFVKASREEIEKVMLTALDELIEYTAIVHAKDRTANGEFRAAGKGDIDFELLLSKIKDFGYEVPVILHGLTEEEVSSSVSYLKKLNKLL